MANQKGVEVWRGQVRLPAPLAEWVKERAQDSFRSLNAEFVEVIREAKRAGEAKNAGQ